MGGGLRLRGQTRPQAIEEERARIAGHEVLQLAGGVRIQTGAGAGDGRCHVAGPCQRQLTGDRGGGGGIEYEEACLRSRRRRTGFTFDVAIPGSANCSAWTSNSTGDHGTFAGLNTSWTAAAVAISPWSADLVGCDSMTQVWCVQDLP